MNEKSRSINTSKNALSAIANKIVTIILTFISRKVFIECIGVQFLGINGLFTNVLSLLCLADLGLSTAVNISLYKPIAQNDQDKICALLSFYKKAYRIIALIILIVGLCLYPLIPYIVNTEKNIPHLGLYYLIFLAKTVVSYICIYKISLINADQKNYLINKITMYFSTIKVIIQIITSVIFKNFLIYIILEVITVLVQNIYTSYKADKMYPFIHQKIELEINEKKKVLSEVSSIFLYKLAYALFTGTDNIIISIVVGTVVVGYYSNYTTITNVFDSTAVLLFSSTVASIGNLVATKGAEQGKSTFKIMQMIAGIISTVELVCMYYLMQDFIQIWLGEKYQVDTLAFLAIISNLYLTLIMYPVWSYREGVGMYQKISRIMVIGAGINIVLSIVLGKVIGLGGIILATILSKLVTYFWYEPKILFEQFFKDKVVNYFKEVFKNFIMTIICIVILIPLNIWKTDGILIVWIIKAIVCVLVCTIALSMRYYQTQEFKMVKAKVLGMIRRKN